jgi:hypothetical protein
VAPNTPVESAINREQNIVRGYDTQGLFWQDVLLRTRQSKTQPEIPQHHVDITGLLVETAKQQGWHSPS